MSRAEEIELHAAEWLSRRDGSNWSPQDRADYDAWVAASPAHEIAIMRLEEVWKRADAIGEIERAFPRPWFGKRIVVPTSIAASLAILVTGGWLWESRFSVVHRTGIGEHQEVRLRDGTNIALNTDTKAITVVADGTREVWLDHGEAFFDVAHDPAHPFVVRAGNQTVTVLGTKFSIRQDGQRFRLAVLSGRVRLTSPARPPGRPLIVAAGEVATAAGENVLVSTESRASQLDDLAWRSGAVMFERVTMRQAVAELNRYSNRKLVITDPALEGMEIGGQFETDNPVSFAHLLADSLNLKVQESPDQIEIGR